MKLEDAMQINIDAPALPENELPAPHVKSESHLYQSAQQNYGIGCSKPITQAATGVVRWVGWLCTSLWKVALDDPRRVVHSLKVGVALAIVSLFMLLEQAYDRIGKNAIWAVMTVVVVFEFTAGATLSKGLNRALGTLIAGMLALGVSQLAASAGSIGEPIVVVIAVFTTGVIATFLRFFPKIKARYDYGVVIFLLTFCLIVVAGSRHGDSIQTATDRLLIISIGCSVALATSLFVAPIWAGDDLHSLIASNFYNIAESLEGCVKAYIEEDPSAKGWPAKSVIEEAVNDPIYKGYHSSLLSSQKEESLANFACWEPPHGRFGWRHPWRKYVQIGIALRHCAYSVLALHCCLRSDIQAPKELRAIFQKDISCVGVGAARVLREWGDCVRTMQRMKTNEVMNQVTKAVKDLQKLLNAHAKLLVDPSTNKASRIEEHDSNLGAISLVHNPRDASDSLWLVSSDKSSEDSSSLIVGGRSESAPDHATSNETHEFHLNLTETDNNHGLRSSLRTLSGMSRMEGARALSLATFTSLLVETVSRLEYVVDAAEEFAEQAMFRKVTCKDGS
ncbi:hypothetical protein O6H91_16G039000 [Diphasiastrum complanatum]|uniref:Uncharacterized protein n=1 Tax=Diphasiastrum complanatum TaxID=34168 RepID=A0ACC2BBJ5_DIPCM|nr:hypothetical protein O6H91_16G039000 [Diphasiastrum complanatum]